MQQSRPGEQRRLFTITNVTRVNSAIRSYCSCRRRGTIRYSSDRLHQAAICRCSVTARSTVPGASCRGRRTRFPFIYFHCHFTDCQDSSIPSHSATLADATQPSRFRLALNSRLHFNHQKCNLFLTRFFLRVKHPITCPWRSRTPTFLFFVLLTKMLHSESVRYREYENALAFCL